MRRYLESVWDSFFPHEVMYPLQLVGCPEQPVGSASELEARLRTLYMLFTYRRGFEGIATTTSVIHSDQGWGCLLRTTQMLLAHFLLRFTAPAAGGGSRQTAELRAAYVEELLPLFFDTSHDSAPFSIHHMIASVWDDKAFRAAYWSPSQGCEAVRRTVAAAVKSGALRTSVTVVCSSNGSLFADDVVMALRSDAEVVLLLTPVRASPATQLTQETYLQLEGMMEHPSCVGMVGGVPGKSYFFFGHSQTQLAFLDPHQRTQPALVDARPEHRGVTAPELTDVRCVHWSRVDTSLYVAFGLRTIAEWVALRAQLSSLRFLCVEDRRSLDDYAMQQQQQNRRTTAFLSPLHEAQAGDPASRSVPPAAAATKRGSTPQRPLTLDAGSDEPWEMMSEPDWR